MLEMDDAFGNDFTENCSRAPKIPDSYTQKSLTTWQTATVASFFAELRYTTICLNKCMGHF